MAIDINDPNAVQIKLWDEIDKHRIGMLGLSNSDQHFQPMTAFVERETRQLWFYTYKDTDLALAAGSGADAMFTFQERDIQACIAGRLSLIHDQPRIDRYWNAMVAAWYAEGKDDPRLSLLRLHCKDAEIWLSSAGPVKLAWEVAKANATHKQPDLGGRTHLNFH